MERKLFLLLVVVLQAVCLNAQKAMVFFQSDEPMALRLHAPVDGFLNERYATDTICMVPGEKYTYELDIDEFAFIPCRLPKGKIELLLFPNDSVTVIYKKGNAIFEGANAEGQFYWNFEYPYSYSARVKNRLENIFQDSTDGQWIQEEVMKISVYDEINALEDEGKVTPAFADAIRMNLRMHYNYNLIAHYYELKENPSATVETRKEAGLVIDSIVSSLPMNDVKLSKYPLKSLYEDVYLNLIYYEMSDAQKAALLKGYDEDTFGPYRRYLLLPIEMQIPTLFEAFVMQYLYKVEEFDKVKMLKYLADNLPDSEAVHILKRMREQNEPDNRSFQHSYLSSSIRSLQELAKAEELQDKWILIDMWATWCMPCRQEFQYSAALHECLKQFPQIAMVYLSIDKDGEEKQWKKDIVQFRLEGYHVRASNEMKQDIAEKLFKGGNIFVPRYVMLNNLGEIVAPDLPRPSDMNTLKSEIEKTLNLKQN